MCIVKNRRKLWASSWDRGPVMLEIIVLVAAVFTCVWLPIEVNKVRSGWVHKRFKGDQAAFLIKYRKQLTMFTWLGLVLGVAFVALAILNYQDQANFIVKLVIGALWIAVSPIALMSRRKLDAGPIAPAAPQA